MRADEHEGDLNDTGVRRQRDQMESEARKILARDLHELAESGPFLRWFGKYAHPMITQDYPVVSERDMAHFLGKRSMVLQIVSEMDSQVPGFLSRVLQARDDYERALLAAAQKE